MTLIEQPLFVTCCLAALPYLGNSDVCERLGCCVSSARITMSGLEFHNRRLQSRRPCRVDRKLHFRHRPEFTEGRRPGAVDDAFPGTITHALSQRRIGN